MANGLTLDIGARDAGGKASLTLTTSDTTVEGSLNTTLLTGAWSSTSIHTALNGTANRSQAESLGKGLFDRLFALGTPIRDQWDALAQSVRRLPLELIIADTELRG